MTESGHSPALFDSFNAKNLAPQDVARTFVPSIHFRTLIGQNHSLILGPRGSGKTTLLKMLQQQALDAWDPVRRNQQPPVGFTGVFIATDLGWGKQISLLGANTLEPVHRALLGVSAFTTHVLRSLTSAMDYSIRRAHVDGTDESSHVRIDQQREAEVARQLAHSWHITEPVGSLNSLKYALGRRLNSIRALPSREHIQGSTGRGERLAAIEYLHIPFTEATVLGIDIFNDALDRPDARWALLFDELELAPPEIRDALLASLRGIDGRILLKLSFAPVSRDFERIEGALAAMPGHDFSVIELWYPHKEDSYHFCRELWTSVLQTHRLPQAAPEAVLGRSNLETEDTEWREEGTAYHPASRLAKRFAALARKDESFQSFLDSHKIDPGNFDRLGSDERAAIVRKITSLVALREAILVEKHRGIPAKLRSVKKPRIYAGATSLFAMVEGNPRWFKGIIGELLRGKNSSATHIPASRQVDEVTKAAHRFRALLRTIPCRPVKAGKSNRGILSLLDILGAFFFDQAVLRDFTLDPIGSFIVDSHTEETLLDSVAQAVNSGAIIRMADSDAEIPAQSPRGQRFRLCYLFAPLYKTLLRAGRPISLGAILKGDERATSRQNVLGFIGEEGDEASPGKTF